VYVPGLRLAVSVLLPPENVGVWPTTAPLLEAIVTLCPTGDWLVKSIVTFPDLALSEVVSYLSAPLGLAASLSELPAPPEDGAAALVLEDVGAAAADDVELDELLEPPQPASARTAANAPAGRRSFVFMVPLFRASC